VLGIRLTNMMLLPERAGASSVYKPIRKLTSHFWSERTSLTRDLRGLAKANLSHVFLLQRKSRFEESVGLT
jgi:hypothetical protein